jgi:hypothetical protein
VVGYAKGGEEARGMAGYFLRRLFWLKLYDRALDLGGPYRTGVPVEAVDPRTVRPKVAGQLTERAYDGRRQ